MRHGETKVPEKRCGSTNLGENMLFLFLSYLTISHCTITVNYPSDAFTHPLIFQNYKVSFSKSLAKQTSYVDLSRAQDREDIWIYENWFYGMEHGVILESGALDGVKYSTSHMFEKFASWRPLHIGKALEIIILA
jgi:hypothetical protein